MNDQRQQSNPRMDSIALERPLDWARRRDAPKTSLILPYFITGDENRLAVFVSQSLSEVLPDGNPILLFGPTGSGKTAMVVHLATRICQYLQQGKQSTSVGTTEQPPSVLYTTSNDFHREYAENVAADILHAMRDKIQKADIWICEDLHHLHDKQRTQEELASRIESRTLEGKITLLTSLQRLSEIPNMRSEVSSRCLSGLTLPMAFPGDDARQQIINELIIRHEIEMGDDLILELLSHLKSNISVRQLDGLVRSIQLWCKANSSLPNSDSVLLAVQSTTNTQPLSLAKINTTVARYFKISRAELRGSSRKQTLVRARSLAMLIARELTSKTMLQIGEYFGGRDHTTVLHAIRSSEKRLESDDSLVQAMNQIKTQLRG